jgi:NADH:ubiquinone oxidoreductase subunit F (NADH-binding)
VAEGKGRSVVVANGSEGEPASAKDRLLLTRSPHLVLDGISLAAYAVGADRAFLAVHGREVRLAKSLEAAAAVRAAAGIDTIPIDVVGIPSRYVSSEQSAIVQFLNGGPAVPTFSPPRTHERGYDGRPTLVNNAETLAHVALIARHGDRWFRSAGVPGAPGTMLVTVSGAVSRPGVYEIEAGTPIGALLLSAGGLAEPVQAILTGGYFGSWLPAEIAWRLPLTHRDVRAVGGSLGAGVIVALPAWSCGLAETARVVRYLAAETAGQCGPCVFGLPALADALADLAYQGRGRSVAQIARLTDLIAGRGACKHPDGATQLARSALAAFCDDAAWHEERGPCPGTSQPPVLSLPGDMADW